VPIAANADKGVLEIHASQDDVEQAFLTTQRRELIAQAIATLPYKERAAIVLRDMEGVSTEAVAQILQSSATTVRSQISSARKKIKDYCRRALTAGERRK
jgi:RNA polymerase sigma-70 factor (ECF subfamily)